jgi:rare lipoprotein A
MNRIQRVLRMCAAGLILTGGLMGTGFANDQTQVRRPETVAAKRTAPKAARGGQIGMASFYANKFQGRRTASGEVYRHGALTAAHRSLAFGRKARVTSLSSGRSVVVRINDRGPFVRGRVIDVSLSAARQLGMTSRGIARVRVDPL